MPTPTRDDWKARKIEIDEQIALALSYQSAYADYMAAWPVGGSEPATGRPTRPTGLETPIKLPPVL